MDNVDVSDAKGKAMDVVATDDVSIVGSDLTNVTEGITANTENGNVEVSDVTATGVSAGVAIDATGKNVTVSDTTLSDVADGVKVTAEEAASVSSVNVTDGNGVAVDVNSNNAKVDNVDVTGNNGTAVKVTGDNANITGVIVADNTGDAISVTGNGVDIDNVAVTGSNGTAISVNGTGGKVADVNLSGNTGKEIDAPGSTVDNSTIHKTYTTRLTITVKDITYGSNVVITLNVTDVNYGAVVNDGSVYVTINNKTYMGSVVNGVATVSVAGLDAGDYNITALYNESSTYLASSASGNVSVAQQATSITAPASVVYINGKYTVTLNTKVAGETVVLTVNGQKLTAKTNANGQATFTLTKAALKAVGVKTVSVSFAGTGNYKASSNTAKLTVRSKVTVTAKAAKKSYKRNAKSKVIKVTLKDQFGKVITGKVTVKFTGKMAKKLKGKLAKKLKKGYTVKVKKGKLTLKLTSKKVKFAKKGKYAFTVTFKKAGYYDKSVKKGTLKIK